MGYKSQNLLKNGKKVIIAAIALFIGLSLICAAPIAVSIVESTTDGQFDLGKFMDTSITAFLSIGDNLGKIFTADYITTFMKASGYVGVLVLLFMVIGLIKSMPKNEYTDIEHGSSDWSNGKEQYKVLSQNKGILLAEKHYLPVDKRGNVNVLVVGRFRFSENPHHMLFQMHINV